MLLVCKKCGNEEKIKKLHDCKEFTVTQEIDPLQPTVCTCNNCGNNGVLQNFTMNQSKIASQGVGGKTQDASDAVENTVDSTETRNVLKKNRKRPEKRIMHNDSEDVRGTVAMSNPFVKSAQSQSSYPDINWNAPGRDEDPNILAIWHRYGPKDEPYKVYSLTLTKDRGMILEINGKEVPEGTKIKPEEAEDYGFRLDYKIKDFNLGNKMAKKNPFVKSAQFGDLESPSQAIKDGKIVAVWAHPKDSKKMFKQTTGGGGMQFTEDGGQTWQFSMRTPEEIDRQGYVKKKGHEPDDTKEREEMGFDNEEEWQDMKNNFASNNPFLKRAESDNNPFVKVAREFKRSPWGQYMKNLSETNMAYPEMPVGSIKNQPKEKSNSKVTNERETTGPYKNPSGTSPRNQDGTFSPSNFNPTDRKEYRSSPKRRDIEPGAAEWEDKEVDKYYDGWVSDHIRNSGGKIIGSNTPEENIMNLDDNQREKDLGNRDMIYERLLEGRHNFNDDYTFVEVADQQYKISKEAARRIVASKLTLEDDNTFVSKAALDLILKKASKKNCDCGCDGSEKCKESDSKKKTLSKKASKFPLLSIPI